MMEILIPVTSTIKENLVILIDGSFTTGRSLEKQMQESILFILYLC